MKLSGMSDWWDLWRHRNVSGEKLRDLQSHRLRKIVSHAYENVPFYQELFDRSGLKPSDIRSIDDVKIIPIVRRADLQSVDVGDLLARNIPRNSEVVRNTSGSTGRPLSVHTRKQDLRFEALGWLRTWFRFGLRPTDLQVAIKDPQDVRGAGRWRLLDYLHLLRIKNLNLYHFPDELVNELTTLSPDVLRGPPSILDAVAKEATASAPQALIRPRLIFTTGEKLEQTTESLLKATFEADVLDCYGATEGGCIAWRCPECRSYHVNSDYVHLEVVSRNDAEASKGIGEVIITNLFSYGMPFIRYALGDLCRISSEVQCGQHRDSVHIREILGRTVDELVLPDGRTVSPYTYMLEDVRSVVEYQVIQERFNLIRILIVRGEGFNEDSLQDFLRQCKEDVGDQCEISIEYVSAIPVSEGNFRRRVISKVSGTRINLHSSDSEQ